MWVSPCYFSRQLVNFFSFKLLTRFTWNYHLSREAKKKNGIENIFKKVEWRLVDRSARGWPNFIPLTLTTALLFPSTKVFWLYFLFFINLISGKAFMRELWQCRKNGSRRLSVRFILSWGQIDVPWHFNSWFDSNWINEIFFWWWTFLDEKQREQSRQTSA